MRSASPESAFPADKGRERGSPSHPPREGGRTEMEAPEPPPDEDAFAAGAGENGDADADGDWVPLELSLIHI